MFDASAHARLVLGCSVSVICLMTSFGAFAQTCVNVNQLQLNDANLTIDGRGNVVVSPTSDKLGNPIPGTSAIVAAVVSQGPNSGGSANLYGLNGQQIQTGTIMNAANATAGGSTPSITTTEVSTDQALELMQRRRNQEATATMISGAASTATVTASAQASQLPAPAVTPKTRPHATRKVGFAKGFVLRRRTKRYRFAPLARPFSKSAIEAYGVPQPQAVLPYSYKDSPEPFIDAALVSNGAWAEGYGEYEFHSNLNPGNSNNPSRNQYTAGLMSGVDHTFRDPEFLGGGSLQLGLLGGYNNTHSTFSTSSDGQSSKQSDDGGFIGAYGTYSLNRFALDFLVKNDFYNHQQTATCPAGSQPVNALGAQVLRELALLGEQQNSQGSISGPINAFGNIAENNLNILSNVYYRFDIGDGYWLEPTVGFRYTYTAYGDNAALFGLENGELWRIQGGARIGTGGITNGYIWSASLLGLLYDDVSIRGYVTPDTAFYSGPATVDQGKLRALGQLFGTVTDGLGWNYWALLEVRGGEDVFAVGGKIGIRYQW